MKLRDVFVAVVAVSGIGLLLNVAQAKTKYQASVIEESPNNTDFKLLKPGKIQIKPSTKSGDGGIVFKLLLTKVDCPNAGAGNDKGKAGKCGVKGAPPDGITDNHVLDIGVRALGTELPGPGVQASAAGILFRYEKGKALFQATGKNKIGGAAFGALSSAVFNQPLGIGLLKLHTAGSNPADCAVPPLLPGNGCTDGDVYAFAGVMVGNDAGTTCASSAECAKTAICQAGVCVTETCTVDSDCDQDGGGAGGTGQCGSGGTCCDPNIDTTCAGQV
ncbi:MAG: hypothetical protein ACE5I7_16320 [Candidatus Binatia bacterium]